MNRLVMGLCVPVFIAVMTQGGCVAADQAPPQIEYRTVLVDHPVACVNEVDIFARPAPLGANPHDARLGEPIALAKVREWERYGDHNDPKLHACAHAADAKKPD
jgi:hypothetical protein